MAAMLRARTVKRKKKKRERNSPEQTLTQALDSWMERKVSAKWFFVLFLQLQI